MATIEWWNIFLVSSCLTRTIVDSKKLVPSLGNGMFTAGGLTDLDKLKFGV